MKKIILLNVAAAAAACILTGCGKSDGTGEYEDGLAAFKAGDFKKAGRLFSESLEAAPSNVNALLMLARVKVGTGAITDAEKIVEEANRLDEEAIDVKMLTAQIAWHLKDYDRSLRLFESVANDGKLDAPVRSLGYSGAGIVEMTRGEHDLARIAFFRAIRTDRRNASAWYHLGLLYRDGFGYNEAALEQFNIFVRLEKVADARVQKVQRTYIPELQEEVARAAADRPGASKRDSAASAAAIAKAEAAMKKKYYKTARTNYEAALKADPLSYPAALGLANVYEKSDASKSGMMKALENYRLACQLRPSAVSTHLAAGALAMRLSYYAQAETIYSRALAADPSKLDAIDGLIRALRRTGVKDKIKIASAYQNYRDSIPVSRRKR